MHSVLSLDELKVRQNLLDSDYEIYMVCLLVATVNWHKSLKSAKKSNIALLPCLFMILLAVSMITLIIYALPHSSQIWVPVFNIFSILIYQLRDKRDRNSKMSQPPKYQEMGFSLFAWHLEKPFRNHCIQKTKMSRSVNDSFAGWSQRMVTIVNLWMKVILAVICTT